MLILCPKQDILFNLYFFVLHVHIIKFIRELMAVFNINVHDYLPVKVVFSSSNIFIFINVIIIICSYTTGVLQDIIYN